MSPEFHRDPILPDIIQIVPKRFADDRGWFNETWNERDFSQGPIAAHFVQDNESRSTRAGTIRGLHFQAPPHAQAKLVRCIRGSILDVVVDLRKGSPTFGQHTHIELSENSSRMVYVPIGFAHGFCTLEANCLVAYKVSAYYAPQSDRGIAHDDEMLAITWPFPPSERTLSERDRQLPRFADLEPAFTMATVQTAP